MTVQIRRATADDEVALGRYGGALMRQHHAADPARFIQVDDPEAGYGRFLVSQLDDEDVCVLVADDDGAVVGYAYAAIEPHSWKDLRARCGYFHDLYVDDASRGHRVGEQLVRTAVAWMKDRGAPRVVMMRSAQNEIARRLAERFGFRATMVEMTCELDAFH